MNIFVNNKPETLTDSVKLVSLLGNLNLLEKQGIAVAVNNSVITKTSWNTFELNENDKVTVIHATQGG